MLHAYYHKKNYDARYTTYAQEYMQTTNMLQTAHVSKSTNFFASAKSFFVFINSCFNLLLCSSDWVYWPSAVSVTATQNSNTMSTDFPFQGLKDVYVYRFF